MTLMRKRSLLTIALGATVLVALLVACGASNGPELQFDAAAYDAAVELQPSDVVPDTNQVRQDAVPQPDAVGAETVADTLVVAKEAAPVYFSDSAWGDHVPHHEIVEFARSDALSSSRMTDPLVMKWRYVPKLAPSTASMAAESPVDSDAGSAAATGSVTESAVASVVDSAAQPVLDTPDDALQDASFTLVTVRTDEGERVVSVPSESYEKICPHRLRMGSEFNDIDFAGF